jgi:hypothetical protein
MNAVQSHLSEIMPSTPSSLGNIDAARNIVKKCNIIVCVATDMQRLQDGWLYQGLFWATAW